MDFPHTKTAKSIPRLFEEIRKVTTPQKVTVSYLKGLGFTSSNDAYLVGLLKGLGFIDGSGVPTARWKEYRGQKPRATMAEAVHDGYKALYATYPDAHTRDSEAIANLVRHNSDYGNDTVARVVSSFRALCDLADFSTDTATTARPPSTDPTGEPTLPVQAAETNFQPGSPVINLNIQLELPASADEKFYDTFFEAMKKHLMS